MDILARTNNKIFKRYHRIPFEEGVCFLSRETNAAAGILVREALKKHGGSVIVYGNKETRIYYEYIEDLPVCVHYIDAPRLRYDIEFPWARNLPNSSIESIKTVYGNLNQKFSRVGLETKIRSPRIPSPCLAGCFYQIDTKGSPTDKAYCQAFLSAILEADRAEQSARELLIILEMPVGKIATELYHQLDMAKERGIAVIESYSEDYAGVIRAKKCLITEKERLKVIDVPERFKQEI